MEYRTTVVRGERTATGLQVPDDVLAQLGAGKRPPVQVTVKGHTYRTTVAAMGGASWVPLAAEHGEAAGMSADDEVDVRIELDTAPRQAVLPEDLANAMDHTTRSAFDALAYSHQKEWVCWVLEAKRPETRATRIAKTVESLRAGKKAR
jgi:Bacteriocin-protection, YdeI or OmpD-Associated/Domain of unknown function (DUF1905)